LRQKKKVTRARAKQVRSYPEINKQIQNLHTRLYHHLMPVSLTIKKALHYQP
jgi:hypothetical protein